MDLSTLPSAFSREPIGSPPVAGYVWRRTYTDAGDGLRSGWADPSIPNDRSTLLHWWASEDERLAEEAAAEAESLAAMDQEPATGAMALAAVGTAVESAQQELTEIRAALTELRDTVAELTLASPEEVLRGTQLLSNVSGLASELDARQRDLLAGIDGRIADLDARVADLAEQQRASIAEVGQAVADARQMAERSTATVAADAKRSLATLISTTGGLLSEMRGPRGDVGAAGTSTVVGAGVPQDASALEKLIGRGAILGDVFIDGSDDFRRAYRWTGQEWEPGPQMVSLITRDVKVSALDASTKVFPTVSTAAGGGGGGSFAADPIYVSSTSVTPNAVIPIADSSRWAATNAAFRSGVVAVEIIPVDGPFGGQTNFVESSFILLAGGAGDTFRFSEGFALGNAISSGGLSVDFSGALGAATAPASLGISLPPTASLAARIFMTLNAPTAPTGASRYLIRGRCEWTPDAATGAAAANAVPLKAPLWQLV